MLSLPKNIVYKILNLLNDEDLADYCITNKKNYEIYNDQIFWLNRIIIKFSYISLDLTKKIKKELSTTWFGYYTLLRYKCFSADPLELLYKSAENGRCDYALLALHRDMSIVNGFGVSRKRTPLISAIENGKTDIAKILINYGANVNQKTIYNSTALQWASSEGHLDTVKYLIKEGADINNQDNEGDTPLMEAAQYGHLDIVKLLLEEGADPYIKNFKNVDAAHKAYVHSHKNIVELLLKNFLK